MKNHLFLIAVLSTVMTLQACQNECSKDSECDDGMFCNGSEKCSNGHCITVLDFPCNDDIPCTIDLCDEESHKCNYKIPDTDQDGYFLKGCLGGDDCNDSNPDIHPGATETCNGLDDDCNDIIDEDKDGDGHFDPLFCPEGGDCDDNNENIYPNAVERCDGLDNNCTNGTDDEEDTDLDGFVDDTCGGDDCNDEDNSINPGVAEVCNGKDDNCDNLCDDTFACCKAETLNCLTPCASIGTSTCSNSCQFGECIPPAETCNGMDDDCDMEIDEEFVCSPKDLVLCDTLCGSIGIGICTDLCQIPEPAECLPPEEECNGKDDDCDGNIDETFICPQGDIVQCITTCDSIGTGYCTDTCILPLPEECAPPKEICGNLIDDDCDELIDESCYT